MSPTATITSSHGPLAGNSRRYPLGDAPRPGCHAHPASRETGRHAAMAGARPRQ